MGESLQVNQQQLNELRNRVLLSGNLQSLGTSRMPSQPSAPKGNPLLKGGLSAVLGALGAVGGTFLAPGAGTAAGGALGSGLGTALGRAIGGESVFGNGGLQEIGTDAVLGGVFSGAGKAAKAGATVGKLATKQAGKEVAEGVGKSAAITGVRGVAERAGRAGTIARVSTLPTATAQSEFVDWTRRMGLQGTGANKFRNVEGVISKLTDQADEVLKGVKATVPAPTVQRTFASWGDGLTGVEKKQFDNLVTSVFKPFAGKQELTALELNQMRRTINSKFPNLFSKMNKGGQLSGAETAANELRAALGDMIDNIGGEAVRPINKDIAIGIRGIPELKKVAEQSTRLQVFGTPVPGAETVRQATSDFIGRQAAGVAKPLTLTNALARQGLREGMTGGFSDQQSVDQLGTTDQVGLDGSMPADPTAMDGGYDPTDQIRQNIQMAMLEDLQTTGGKRVPALKSVLETLTPAKPSAAATKAQLQTSTVMNRVSQLGELFTQAGGGRGRIGGLAGSAAGAVGLDENAYNYNQFRDSLLAPLARAISGEVGVLTDRDIKRADGLLPKLTDSPQEARRRLELLMQSIQEQQMTNQQVYAGGAGGGLSDALYNMEGVQY